MASEELTPEIVDQIVFGMENQETRYLFDTLDQLIVEVDDLEETVDEERYIALPNWNSAMGFQLMERFVASLRNPLFRDLLRETLASGRGVFRKFKNALKDRPDIEMLWFRFKEREMRRLVYEWFNEYRETIGLDRIAIDEEETAELVLSDFVLVEPATLTSEREDELAELDRSSFFEMYDEYPQSIVELMYARSRNGKSPKAGEVLIAETPQNELAGLLWFEVLDTADSYRLGLVRQLTVLPEFRGLGIARTLLNQYMSRAVEARVDRLLIELGGTASDFTRVLEAVGFEEVSASFVLDLPSWSEENSVG